LQQSLHQLTPLSHAYLDKLEHIRGAVTHHMYEEEGNWFIDLKEKITPSDQLEITQRYEEDYCRAQWQWEIGPHGTTIQDWSESLLS
jgi:hypothetical protein